jgi:hypothetical protein
MKHRLAPHLTRCERAHPPVICNAMRWLKYQGANSTALSPSSSRASTRLVNAWLAPAVIMTRYCRRQPEGWAGGAA